MSEDKMMRLAHQAGMVEWFNSDKVDYPSYKLTFLRFARLVAANQESLRLAARDRIQELEDKLDAINMTPDRVDETAKGEHEPLYMDMSQVPKGTPNWKPGMVVPSPKRDSSSWVDIEEEEINALWQQFDVAKGWSPSVFALAVAHKLKEKNA